MTRILRTLTGVLFFCLLTAAALAQAAPVPVNLTASLIDRTTGQPLTGTSYTNYPCYLHLTYTNTRPADTAGASLTVSPIITSQGTNADGSNGTKTVPVTLLTRPAVSNAVTFSIACPAPTGLTYDTTVALSAGLTFAGNVFAVSPITAPGGASGSINFPVSVTF